MRGPDKITNAALAERIVRAVNAHAALVRVAEQIAWRYEQEQRDGMAERPGAIAHDLGQAARAALALASRS